jgi:hypothetical protein
VLVVGYAAFVVFGLTSDLQPRLFWTVLLPLLPISIVLMGFANWRNICPLAFFGEIGRTLNRGKQRHVPKWLERGFFVVTFSILLAMLVLRLVATNGDGAWLSGLLVGLAVAALLSNWAFTGKTWCNFICPVGLVERIYTEPRSLPTTANSQCIRCTACKSSCPDIDPENAYWRDLTGGARRLATYAFPGLVLAFYTYYWLRHGNWEAYFDGRWTRLPAGYELAMGPGLFFAPEVPAIVAAMVTLLAFSAVSFGLFALLEAVSRRWVDDAERGRHLILALAAFAAFSMFYVFAGAPTLREIPGGARAVAFGAPLLATLFLAKRWPRTRERFIREKSAAQLLRRWPFDEAPPDDPREVYAWIKAGEHARDRQLTAYANTMRDMIAEGLVQRGELRLLDGVRQQLGISEREHDKILARLTEEERDLFERDPDAGAEERAQLETYQTALAEALLRHAPEGELRELQQAFGVGDDAHRELHQRMRGESGVLLDRARAQMEQLRGIRDDLEALASSGPSTAKAFLIYLLLKDQGAAVNRAGELLGIVGESRGAEDLVRELEAVIVDPMPFGSRREARDLAEVLGQKALAPDPYLRSAAVWVAAGSDAPWARSIVDGARDDDHALVRETAALGRGDTLAVAHSEKRFASLVTVEKMQFVRSVSLFADLDPEDLHDLCSFAQEETVDADGVLCEEGDTESDDLFILVSGTAAVVLRGDDGAGRGERRIAVLGVGEVVGELSLLDGSPRSATVRPKDGAIRVLRISGARFRSRLLPRSRVAQSLLVTLAQRIRDLSRRVMRD